MTNKHRYLLARAAFTLVALTALPLAALTVGYRQFGGALLQMWFVLPVIVMVEYWSGNVVGERRYGLQKVLDKLPLWWFIGLTGLGIGIAVLANRFAPDLVWPQILAALLCVLGLFEASDRAIHRDAKGACRAGEHC